MCHEAPAVGSGGTLSKAFSGQGSADSLDGASMTSSKKRIRAEGGGLEASAGLTVGVNTKMCALKDNQDTWSDGSEDSKGPEPPSPQNTCQVAGILLQTKKRRIMRRRVCFSKESKIRLVSRDLLLAQYNLCEPGDDGGAGYDEEEAYEDAGGSLPRDEDASESEVINVVDDDTTATSSAPSGSGLGSRKCAAGVPCSVEGGDFSAEDETDLDQGGGSPEASSGDELAASSVSDESKEDDEDEDMSIETKTNDGPSLINVVTQTLIIGLVERDVRNVGDVLHALRRCVAPRCFEEWEAQQATDSDSCCSSCSSASSSDEDEAPQKGGSRRVRKSRPPVVPDMIVEPHIFEETRTHLAKLLDRINSHGRASLLPSTAQIGPPFVPALEFLLQSTRDAEARNEADRRRLFGEPEDEDEEDDEF